MANDWINEPLTIKEEGAVGKTKSFTRSRTNRVTSHYYSNAGHPHTAVNGANIPVEPDEVDQQAEYERYVKNYVKNW